MTAVKVIGLDIGSRNVKIALVRRNGGEIELCDYVIAEAPWEQEEGARERFVVESVRDFLQKNGLRRVPTYCCLPAGVMGESAIELPPMGGKELKQAVRMYIRKKLGSAENSFVSDSLAMPASPGGKNGSLLVQVATIPKELPEALVRITEKSGLEVGGIRMWGAAMENVIRMAGLSSGTSVAVLEIGAARSAIGVLRDGHLRFAREIRAGGDGFTKALMEVPIHAAAGEFLDLSSAERMKRHHGILLHGDAKELGESGDRFSAMLRPQVERLVLEVKRSVEYYTQSINQEGVRELYLSGGGARLRNLAASLSEQLGMDVRDLPVRDCVKFSSEVVEQRFKKDAMVLSAAIGAALGRGKQLNLLPKATRVDRTIAKVKKWSQVATAVALAALLLGYFRAGKDLARLESSIKGTKEAMSLLQGGLGKVETVETLRSQLASARDYIAQRRLHRPHWIGLLKEMSNIIPDDIELRQWVWSLDADPKSVVLQGKVLEQTVAKNLAISEFVLRLEGSPFFRDARLLPAQGSSDGKSSVFEISCELVY